MKSTLPPSERRTQLSREDFVKTQPELITKAFDKAELLEYWGKKIKERTLLFPMTIGTV